MFQSNFYDEEKFELMNEKLFKLDFIKRVDDPIRLMVYVIPFNLKLMRKSGAWPRNKS